MIAVNWVLHDEPLNPEEQLVLAVVDHLLMGTNSAHLRKVRANRYMVKLKIEGEKGARCLFLVYRCVKSYLLAFVASSSVHFFTFFFNNTIILGAHRQRLRQRSDWRRVVGRALAGHLQRGAQRGQTARRGSR